MIKNIDNEQDNPIASQIKKMFEGISPTSNPQSIKHMLDDIRSVIDNHKGSLGSALINLLEARINQIEASIPDVAKTKMYSVSPKSNDSKQNTKEESILYQKITDHLFSGFDKLRTNQNEPISQEMIDAVNEMLQNQEMKKKHNDEIDRTIASILRGDGVSNNESAITTQEQYLLDLLSIKHILHSIEKGMLSIENIGSGIRDTVLKPESMMGNDFILKLSAKHSFDIDNVINKIIDKSQNPQNDRQYSLGNEAERVGQNLSGVKGPFPIKEELGQMSPPNTPNEPKGSIAKYAKREEGNKL